MTSLLILLNYSLLYHTLAIVWISLHAWLYLDSTQLYHPMALSTGSVLFCWTLATWLYFTLQLLCLVLPDSTSLYSLSASFYWTLPLLYLYSTRALLHSSFYWTLPVHTLQWHFLAQLDYTVLDLLQPTMTLIYLPLSPDPPSYPYFQIVF